MSIERLQNFKISYLFLRKTRTDANNVDNVALDYTNVCKLTSAKCFKLLAFTLSLLLLLSETFVAG